MIESALPDFALILPEIILSLLALGMLGAGALKKKISSSVLHQGGYLLIGGVVIAFLSLVCLHKAGGVWTSFEGQVRQDDFIYFGKLLILGGVCAGVALSLPVLLKDQLFSFEYGVLVLLATTGMLLMMGAHDFLILFVGLEMQGLALYILAALNRDQGISAEAALKYFILGAVASAVYLYGVSFLYGFSGSTDFEGLRLAIGSDPEGRAFGLFVGLIFVIGAFAFKLSIVPFHMWTPDVYEGCPLPVTTFIATVPKVVPGLVLMRLMMDPFLQLQDQWSILLLALSVLSLLVGTFGALGQVNIRRFLAYSTISQMGYVLLGIGSGLQEGRVGVLLYLSLYLVTILGTFGCLLCLRSKNPEGGQMIEDLTGLSRSHPKIAGLFALFMVSLAGVPPFAGFFAKFYIFKAALSSGFYHVTIFAVLMSIISAYYYLNIVKKMYFDEWPDSVPEVYGDARVVSSGATLSLSLCAVITTLFCLWPGPGLDFVQRAAVVFRG